ncbi:unnamed protein product [Trichobilharzia szidati]|nr:unnamed protein product [Trichobilharzia szidati]
MSVWNFTTHEQLSSFKTVDVTSVQWLPDGEHLIFSTTTPRLRVNNGFGIWHYSGKQLSYQPVERRAVPRPATMDLPAAIDHELYQVSIVSPAKLGPPPEPKSFMSAANSTVNASVNKPASVYVPPSLRNRSAVAIQAMKASAIGDSTKLPVNADKNSKNKQSNAVNTNKSVNNSVVSKGKNNNDATTTGAIHQTASDPKNQKQVNQICKKLSQIEKLKEEQASGKALAFNQLEKIATEQELRDELARLCL